MLYFRGHLSGCPLFFRAPGRAHLSVIMNEGNMSLVIHPARGRITREATKATRGDRGKGGHGTGLALPGEEESHGSYGRWMRRQRTLKPETCSESGPVIPAGRSTKEGLNYTREYLRCFRSMATTEDAESQEYRAVPDE